MRIGLVSDIHLEFGNLILDNKEDVEVLILAGDICIASDFKKFPRNYPNKTDSPAQSRADEYRTFFAEISSKFPHIVYVMGNHEHYHGNIDESKNILKEELSVFPNIHILDRDIFDLGEYRFVGCTLWTDCNKNDYFTIQHLKGAMNDFSIIRIANAGYRRWLPENSIVEHMKCLTYIKHIVDSSPDKKIIVCGHHAPSYKSIHPKYSHQSLMNGGYASDLSELILDNPSIKLWVHGHVHSDFDYDIGETRICCNPRGYVDIEIDRDDFYTYKLIEV